jgi:hypothetical protein
MTKMHCHSAWFSLPLLVFWQPVAAQPSATLALEPHAVLTAEDVVSNLVRKNLERAQALGAYQGTRIYRLDYRGFPTSRSAEMVVDVRYQAPGTKEFTIRSQSGSKLLLERVLKKLLQSEKEALGEENQKRTALNNDNYLFALLGYEGEAGDSLYILSVEPRTKNKFLYRGRIWVEAKDFAVVRIEAEPAKNPSFWTTDTSIEQVYAKVRGFWLPASNRSTSRVRLGGYASLTIDYKDYQITAAIPLSKPEIIVAGQCKRRF